MKCANKLTSHNFEKNNSKKSFLLAGERSIVEVLTFLKYNEYFNTSSYNTVLVCLLDRLYSDVVDQLRFLAIKSGLYYMSDSPKRRFYRGKYKKI